MPGRNYTNGTGYRYGFNKGSEKDYEINPGLYSTFYRELDTRLSNWWSVDPKANEMPWQSPYSTMDNSPILLNDPKGDCATCIVATYEAAVAGYELYIGITTLEALFASTSIVLTEAEQKLDAADINKHPKAHLIEDMTLEEAKYWTKDDPKTFDIWLLHKYKGIPTYKAAEMVDKLEEAKMKKLEMAKKGPVDLVGQAKEQKAKEQKAKEEEAKARAQKKESQSKKGKGKKGGSNKDVLGEHSNGGKDWQTHSKANARRAREQGKKGADQTK